MAKEDVLEIEGVVIKIESNMCFRVELTNGHKVLCHLNGKMRQHKIRISIEDCVKVEMSPYDLSKGRITYRQR